MEILTAYEKVSLRTPLEQRKFFNYYNESVEELAAQYSDFLFNEGEEFTPICSLNDKSAVRSLYHDAIVDNITFLAGGDASYKAEFARKAENAYLKYWNDNAKGRHTRRSRW